MTVNRNDLIQYVSSSICWLPQKKLPSLLPRSVQLLPLHVLFLFLQSAMLDRTCVLQSQNDVVPTPRQSWEGLRGFPQCSVNWILYAVCYISKNPMMTKIFTCWTYNFPPSISLALFHLLIKIFSLGFSCWLFWLFTAIPEHEFRRKQEAAFTAAHFTVIYNSFKHPIPAL